VHCLILTAFDDDEASYAAVLAGASGYVLKDIRGHRLIDGIRRVARGESLVTEAVTSRVVTELRDNRTESPASRLTSRERQVLELIAEGLTNRQIGDRLELAEKTVKNYVSALSPGAPGQVRWPDEATPNRPGPAGAGAGIRLGLPAAAARGGEP
jgi:two-component system response regulator DevR